MEVLKKTQHDVLERIKEINEQGIQPGNTEYLDKLVDIYKDIEEVEDMRYEYGGRGPGHGSYGDYSYGNYNRGYGEYNERYGRRGRDSRYRGYEKLDRMYEGYGEYQDSRERYGDSQEIDKSFHYMVKALEDFIKVLQEEAEGPQQRQTLNEAIQNSMM